MKTLKNLVLVLLVSLAVTACSKKDDDGGDGGTAANGKITGKVSGSNFSSNTSFTSATESNAGGSTSIFILGSDNSGKAIQLMISGVDGAGTYNIGGGANVFTTASYTEANVSNPQASQTWQAPYDDTVAGEIKITEKTDTNIKGTFSFEAKNVNGDQSLKNVTEGSFNIDF